MKSPLWTSEEICSITHSSLCSRDHFSVTGIAIHSGDVQKGDLFVAIKGERVDGHDFLEDAFARGAVAALVDRHVVTTYPCVVVRNTLEALSSLGCAARNRFSGKIVGVTGSAGKTSTKDMLGLVLGSFGKTYATKRSFNSTVTVPLSLALADPDLEYGIFEIGMNKPGEIEALTKMVRPHIGIITNVAPAHLQNFGSVTMIAQEKGSIFLGVSSEGAAIIPGDNPESSILEGIAQQKRIKNLYRFGETKKCEARLVRSYKQESRFAHDVEILGHSYTIQFQMPGKHWAYNAMVALLVAHHLKLDLAKVCEILGQYGPSDRRGVPVELSQNILLVDESYNANPLSMRMALESFGERDVQGKKILVLGEMRELGPDAEALHRGLLDAVQNSGGEVLLTCGAAMKALHDDAKNFLECHHFNSVDDLINFLLPKVQSNDAVMVKASLSMGFLKIVEALKQKFEGR